MHSQSIDVDRCPNAIDILIENDPCGMHRPYDDHAFFPTRSTSPADMIAAPTTPLYYGCYSTQLLGQAKASPLESIDAGVGFASGDTRRAGQNCTIMAQVPWTAPPLLLSPRAIQK